MDGTVDFKKYLPEHRDLFYGGSWHAPLNGSYVSVLDPATGRDLGKVAAGTAADAERAITHARAGFACWKRVAPKERAAILREMARILRSNDRDLAMLDAIDSGNPVSEMIGDVHSAAAQLEFFAGLIPEIKGASRSMGSDSVDFSVREPLGVVARIIPFNHPLMFVAGKSAAPLAAGNAVIMKPPEQAPLSALRFAELVGDLVPPGVLSILPGDSQVGALLARHPEVAMIALVGSVPTGKAVMRAAADTLKPVLLELGGKNALIAYPDADPRRVARAVVDGMNFAWCGQSCGSTSRAFIHESIHDEVVEHVQIEARRFQPGVPTDEGTSMGAVIDKRQFDKVLAYIDKGIAEGGRLAFGGRRIDLPSMSNGHFIEPTIFSGIDQSMTIAREEIFGPVLSIIKWSDESAMISDVNSLNFGLTCSIWTNDLNLAHKTASEIEAGYIWINDTSRHFLGAPFGGYKQSGIGKEECLEELLSFTQEKHIHISLTN